jgi:hypothetical protein
VQQLQDKQRAALTELDAIGRETQTLQLEEQKLKQRLLEATLHHQALLHKSVTLHRFPSLLPLESCR